ncbi:hypothetical protein PF005_g22914 [Phytophthora fragariae]|uniref:RWP-RK domain-containing protein n=1 Tax=Phytophthora fragariae TaxID=53985 RepID=A0A6A3ISH5_9STRA|nr:hypothetical protein PF003_g34445 [Phytophthora fragariae]KAE8926084.1 hypothetical protein PF009_g23720 [Phytophthora fragariae]KAE8982413.1 hypothetical protein PF011_g21626 [Phytophthora fragariae]KAE9080127.1 hypothetical protein PF010_g22502 [Phytophthora fragariae]KAE9080516.1 hypothetical protein PF007_g23022 [Phytophthora fragariae]
MCVVPPIAKVPTNIFLPEKTGRRKFDFPIETLQAYSHLPQHEAARELGVSAITLKRNCQRHKYRWPYQTIKARARRAARLEAQRLQNKTFLDVQMTPPSSPSTLAPELLLHLRNGNQKTFNPSPTYPFPTLVSNAPSLLLQALSLLLVQHRLQSRL